MVYEFHRPAFPLNQFIESFIYYKDVQPDHSMERYLPDGNITLIIDLTDRPKYIYDNKSLQEIQACNKVWFSGIRNTYITIPAGQDSEMLIVNFHKGRSYPFLKMPVHELTDQVVDGELVFSSDILQLREELINTVALLRKFQIVEDYLIKKYQLKLTVNPFITFAVDKIIQAPNAGSMEKLALQVGFTPKHMIRLFKDHVGMSPKSFLKVIRFQKAISDIAKRSTVDWTSIAVESGYYDQAHFIHDFKHFSGFTPQVYLKKQMDFPNYIPVL